LKVAGIAKAPSRRVSRGSGGETPRSESLFAEMDMEAHFLLELRGVAIAEKEKSQPAKELRQPGHIVLRRD
jgi:hypothetical protein